MMENRKRIPDDETILVGNVLATSAPVDARLTFSCVERKSSDGHQPPRLGEEIDTFFYKTLRSASCELYPADLS